MKKLSSIFLILTLSACVYSNGERVGRVVRLSHKGIFVKSYEGELATQARGHASTYDSNIFKFSVKDADVASKIQNALNTGRVVSLKYDHSLVTIPWKAQTPYLITDVKVIQ